MDELLDGVQGGKEPGGLLDPEGGAVEGANDTALNLSIDSDCDAEIEISLSINSS